MTNSPGYSKGPRFESNVAGRQQREVVAPGNDWGEQTVVNRETQASIMVVDDQPANLKLMEDMLRRQGLWSAFFSARKNGARCGGAAASGSVPAGHYHAGNEWL
jgi:hypothetical protein